VSHLRADGIQHLNNPVSNETRADFENLEDVMARKSQNRRKRKQNQRTATWIAVAGVALVVLALVWVFAGRSGAGGSGLPAEISVQQAYQRYQAGDAFFLDVRTPPEWEEYHIPDTTLIPLDELPNRLDEVPRDRPIVVVCRSGNRSAVGRDILKQAGFTNVTSMAGGVKTWRTAGYPVVSGP